MPVAFGGENIVEDNGPFGGSELGSSNGDDSGVGGNPALDMRKYQLGYRYYKRPELHRKDYFLTTSLGAPFPSYHTNPEPNFAPRWTQIPNVVPPCENITAPRIRLGPKELEKKVDLISSIPNAARAQSIRPTPIVLNLSHQSLGDPYQYDSLRAFLELNATVEVLNLDNNELEDISELPLDSVRKLYLSDNNFVTFNSLPAVMPNLEELYVKKNFITGTSGLTQTRFPRLRKLCVFANPLESSKTYRQDITGAIPTIRMIDMYTVRK